jgi:hypothetical protein
MGVAVFGGSGFQAALPLASDLDSPVPQFFVKGIAAIGKRVMLDDMLPKLVSGFGGALVAGDYGIPSET